ATRRRHSCPDNAGTASPSARQALARNLLTRRPRHVNIPVPHNEQLCSYKEHHTRAPACPRTSGGQMPPTGPIALEVESVTVRFGALAALSDVSLGVESGTIHAIVGPNGAGKSTLFNVVSGLFRPSQGRVSVLGTEVTAAPPHLVAALGVARSFQNVSAAGTDTVFENLMLGRHRLIRSGLVATGLRLARARREEQAHAARVREIAEFMDLTAHLDKPVGSLPYGDQKRVDL